MILASQSPRRRELLCAAGFKLTVLPTDTDETPLPGEHPQALVERLACDKAHACAATLDAGPDDGLLVAADTIVWTDEGEILGKPTDLSDARRMLADLSGTTHHVSTGVCALVLSATAEILVQSSFTETTDVEFWPLTEDEIFAYAATGEPLDKAGAYGIQGTGRLLVRRISGDYQNVVGLPVSRLVRELERLTGQANLIATIMRGTAHA